MKQIRKIWKILLPICASWVLFSSYLTVDRIIWAFNSYTYEDYEKNIEQLPIFSEGYYREWHGISFLDRFDCKVDDNLLKFIDIENKFNDRLAQKTKPGHIDEEILYKFKELYCSWPELLKDFCENHVVKVLVVDGLGSSGMIYSVKKNELFIIFLDQKVFQLKPNEWKEEVESTAIKIDDSSITFEAIIESENNIERTVENILIHEIGHGIGVLNRHTPNFNLLQLNDEQYFPFFDGLYTIKWIEMSKSKELPDEDSHLKYYTNNKGKISQENYIELLRNIKHTPQPTMYSSQNSFELYAEAFYSYVHCIIQKRPYVEKIFENGRQVESLENGFIDGRSYRFKIFFDQFFLEGRRIRTSSR